MLLRTRFVRNKETLEDQACPIAPPLRERQMEAECLTAADVAVLAEQQVARGSSESLRPLGVAVVHDRGGKVDSENLMGQQQAVLEHESTVRGLG